MEAAPPILVIRLTAIGDVVLTLPAISVLRANYPAARITFLTTQENRTLLEGFRDVDETISLDRAELRSGNPWRMSRELFRLLRRLRAGKFSLVVDLQANGESGWLTWLTGARQRWGFFKKPSRRWAYTACTGHLDHTHPAEANCALLRHCGLASGDLRNVFSPPAGAMAAARDLFQTQNLRLDKPTLLIQPLTSGAHKNWPLENYLAVARHWRERGLQIVFVGGPVDRAALEPAGSEKFCVAVGQPLLVSAALAKLSTFMLGGDTGLGHIAVATGRRVLMLMVCNEPGCPVPFGHPEWTVVPPAGQPISRISVTDAIAATERAFSEAAGSAAC